MINDAWFLKTNFFSLNSLLFALLVAVAIATIILGSSKSLEVNVFLSTIIFPFRTIYGSLKSHKSDISIDVLFLIYLLTL